MALGLYLRYARLSIRSQLVYRASFVMSMLGAAVITAVEFVAMWALFERFGQLRGWVLPQIALLYGMVSIEFALCDAIGSGFEEFATLIRDGGFDRLLVRPRSTVLQLLGQDLVLRRGGRLLQGSAVLGYALTTGAVETSPAHVLLLVATLACGVCAFLGVVVLQATSAFWTVDALEVWNVFTYGGVKLGQYPLAIYRSWFRALFTFVIPLGCVTYFPGLVLLGRVDPLGTPAIVGWLAPLAGPVFLAITLQVWKIGVRHYRSTGG